MTLQNNISLKNYNTFKLEASARYFLSINSIKTLKDFCNSDKHAIQPKLILGGGSNMLFTKDFEGVILKSEIKEIDVLSESESEILVRAGSGIVWDDFVAYCVERNWGGTENLSYIPGNVGATPVQNIGAYGVEAKDIIDSVEGYDISSNSPVRFNNKECKFDYRFSIFKTEKYKSIFITHVIFRLSKNPKLNTTYGSINKELEKYENKNIQVVREVVIQIRKSKLPEVDDLGNAGSFFKNPVLDSENFNRIQTQYPEMPFYKVSESSYKIPAAWLIESCNLKGYKHNQVGTYNKQPLVIVNYGGGKGKDIVELSDLIKNRVNKQFGITLHPEVCFV